MRYETRFFHFSFTIILIVVTLSANLTGLHISGMSTQYSLKNNSAEAAIQPVTSSRIGTRTQQEVIFSVTEGKASFYADQFHGRKTANGETFNMEKLTAAHPSLPFGTRVRVTNLRNGKDVIVRINDRGPFIKGRIIDLSIGAAKEIGLIKSGTTQVKLETLRSDQPVYIPS